MMSEASDSLRAIKAGRQTDDQPVLNDEPDASEPTLGLRRTIDQRLHKFRLTRRAWSRAPPEDADATDWNSNMILPKVRDPRFVTIRRGGSLADSDHDPKPTKQTQ